MLYVLQELTGGPLKLSFTLLINPISANVNKNIIVINNPIVMLYCVMKIIMNNVINLYKGSSDRFWIVSGYELSTFVLKNPIINIKIIDKE